MTLADVMADLKKNGSDSIKKIFTRHGAREPFFGVKVEHLKTIQKKIKRDKALSLELYATGNSDAMYLAGLVSDPMAMTKAELITWVEGAYWYMLSCFTVPWTASESRYGRELALKWMKDKNEQTASAGWCTYASLLAIQPDEELDLDEISGLLATVEKTIHTSQNRVKSSMNNFVIAVGAYVVPLLPLAKKTAKAIGVPEVDMGDTSCKINEASASIAKIEAMGRVGKKRKTAFC
jgi:3-methyladenine DNA glycosylase AlkD